MSSCLPAHAVGAIVGHVSGYAGLPGRDLGTLAAWPFAGVAVVTSDGSRTSPPTASTARTLSQFHPG